MQIELKTTKEMLSYSGRKSNFPQNYISVEVNSIFEDFNHFAPFPSPQTNQLTQ